MLHNLPKISNTAAGLIANPKSAYGLPASLGVKPGLVNFQQLMSSRLGAAKVGNRMTTLSLLNSVTRKLADFTPRALGKSELHSLKQIVQSLKAQAGKSQKPLAFQLSTKSFGPISFEIEPLKNQLRVGLDEKQLDAPELFIAELAPLFDRIEFGPGFSDQLSAAGRQSSAISFQPSALGSQLSVAQAFGLIQEFVQVSGKLPVLANDPGQKIELNVDSIGSVLVNLKPENSKLQIQIGLPSRQTLERFKAGFLKTASPDQSNIKFFLSTSRRAAQLTPTSDKIVESKNALARDRQTAKISIGQAVETIQKKVAEVRYPHSTVKNHKQTLNLDVQSLGKVLVEIKSGKDKIRLNVGVDSQVAGNVLKKKLGSLAVKANDLNIWVRSPKKNTGKKVANAAPLANLGSKITPPQAVATVEKVVEVVAQTSAKVSSKLKFALQTDSLGDIEANVETSSGKANLKLTVDSNSAKNFLLERLGQKIQNLEIRVKENGASQRVKGVESEFKLDSKLRASQVVQSIREVAESVLQAPTKSGQKGIQVQMVVENFGKISVQKNKDGEDGSVILRTDSSQARDWLAQHLAKSGLKVKTIKTADNTGVLELKLDSKLTETLETAAKADTVLQPKESTAQPVALKKFAELMETLLGSAPLVKSQTAKLSNTRQRTSNKPSKDKVSALGKDSRQDSSTSVFHEDKVKLKDDLNSPRKFSGEILENIEGDSAEFGEQIPSESERLTQPILTSNNVNFDFLGGKLVGSGVVERSYLPQMIQKILDFANSQSNTAGQKLEVQLDVEKLGSLLVDAVKHKDKINLHINVDNSEVRRMLEGQLRPLVDQMIKEGIEVGRLEVSVKNESADDANDWQTTQNEQEFREQNSNFEQPAPSYAEEASPASRQRDFGYNSIEVLA